MVFGQPFRGRWWQQKRLLWGPWFVAFHPSQSDHRSAALSIPPVSRGKNSATVSRAEDPAAAENWSMVVFEHEKLEVYKVAVEYADAAEEIASLLQGGHAHVRDQLR